MPKAASVEDLLKSGAHFGHLTRRWNPKMKEFIFMQRNGIHVIDLKKSHSYLQEILDEITKLARAGKTILFVGTKKQAQEIIKTEAIRCGMPFITHRWLGGMLTNFSTVRKSITRMEEIDRMKKEGTYDELTKKEGLMLDREKEKLEQTLGGIANMNRLPGAIFVVDTIKEHIAINEAVKLNIPIAAIVDTNSDPDIPDFIVPANDDSARTIQLIAGQVADAIIEGNAEREAMKEEELMEEAAAEAKKAPEKEEDVEISDVGGKSKRRKRRRKKTDDEEAGETKKETKSGDEETSKEKTEPEADVKDSKAEAEKKEETKKTETADSEPESKKEEEKSSEKE
ncbi:MAG: 30S ribosomal protein S2 [Balneolaceae bacterium]